MVKILTSKVLCAPYYDTINIIKEKNKNGQKLILEKFHSESMLIFIGITSLIANSEKRSLLMLPPTKNTKQVNTS